MNTAAWDHGTRCRGRKVVGAARVAGCRAVAGVEAGGSSKRWAGGGRGGMLTEVVHGARRVGGRAVAGVEACGCGGRRVLVEVNDSDARAQGIGLLLRPSSFHRSGRH